MSFQAVVDVGAQSVFFVLLGFAVGFGAAVLVATRLGLTRRLAVLLAVGTAICLELRHHRGQPAHPRTARGGGLRRSYDHTLRHAGGVDLPVPGRVDGRVPIGLWGLGGDGGERHVAGCGDWIRLRHRSRGHGHGR
ncbi:MAG: hypothetical protein FJ029_15680 [Actinobacteria bacterium]|nr:hypothetical protein [Actinomycetota bacterium]